MYAEQTDLFSNPTSDVKANSFQIADILGHKSERTTRRYVHAKKSALLDAVGML